MLTISHYGGVGTQNGTQIKGKKSNKYKVRCARIMTSDVFTFQRKLMQTVGQLLGSPEVKPGFQYLPELIKYEQETSFATGDAIGAFARASYKRYTSKQIKAERKIVKKLINKLVDNFTEDELARKCFNISCIIALMLEELGIWAVVYRGTLIYDAKGTSVNRFLYYIDDLFNPPVGSDARGHSWVFTPSYPVIDLTSKHQPLPDDIKRYVPVPVLVEQDGPYSPELKWYLDLSESSGLIEEKKKLLDSYLRWPCWNQLHRKAHFKSNEIDLHYIPMDIMFPEKPLPITDSDVTIGGQLPFDFYKQIKKELYAV